MVEKEKSCGALVFRKEGKEIFYLILYKKASNHYREAWDFPRGNVEQDESEKEVASREIKEESGIKITELNFVPGFRETIEFFYRREGNLVKKEIIFLLAQTTQEKVKLSCEHDDYKWAGYDKAIELLTYKSSKEILGKAHAFLKVKFKQKTLI